MKYYLSFLFILTLGGCSSTPSEEELTSHSEPVFSAERVLPAGGIDETSVDAYDPWEPMNRRIYNFNYHFDNYVFLPVANGYQYITPDIAQQGVSNFFNNINDFATLINTLLQLKPAESGQSLGRVAVNTTIGLLGLIDVATAMEIPRPVEDFGQTLGYWGVNPGPYLVLPILGPSNLRDGIGLIPDMYVRKEVLGQVFNSDERTYLSILAAISTRSNTPFRYYGTGSAFEYETIRWLYSTKREIEVAK